MLYFLQTAVSEKKHLEKALQSIYGVGQLNAKTSCLNYGLINDARGKDLRRLHRLHLKTKFDDSSFELGADLKRTIKSKCVDLIDISSYRGRRHKSGYPVRGQRTHTNAKTQKKLLFKTIIQSQSKSNNNLKIKKNQIKKKSK